MELYNIEGRTHLKFLKDFYDLSLKEKYEIINKLDPLFLSDYLTMERLVLAILQHSTKKSRDQYPVKSVRKLSLKAKLADETNNNETQYGLESEEQIERYK